jgi:ABC-type multidrug transport system fused ATPase/permease subunit
MSSLAMPLLMIVFAHFRSGVQRRVNAVLNKCGIVIVKIVQESCRNYSLISLYQQRPQIFDIFFDATEEVDDATVQVNIVKTNSMFCGLLVGPLFIAIHIIRWTPHVLAGEMTLGIFLATISVYKEFQAVYRDAYSTFLLISVSLSGLKNVTHAFNMPLDLLERKEINRTNRERLKAKRLELTSQDKDRDLRKSDDSIDIEITNLSWNYLDVEVLREVTLSVPQGSIVALAGQHHSGRNTLMKILGKALLDEKNSVFIPSHLRTLYCPEDLNFALLGVSAWANLTIGLPDAKPSRVKNLLRAFEMDRTLAIVEQDLEKIGRRGEMDDDSHESHKVAATRSSHRSNVKFSKGHGEVWHTSLSTSERLKFALLRALVMNPEVLLLQRPTSSFEVDEKERVMSVLVEHVRNRGYLMAECDKMLRRPRTLFFSSSTTTEAQHADFLWVLDANTKSVSVKDRNRSEDASAFSGLSRSLTLSKSMISNDYK